MSHSLRSDGAESASPVEDAGLGAGLQGGPRASPTHSARMKGVAYSRAGRCLPQARPRGPPRPGLSSGLPAPRVHPSPVHSQVFILLPFSAFLLFIFLEENGRKNQTQPFSKNKMSSRNEPRKPVWGVGNDNSQSWDLGLEQRDFVRTGVGRGGGPPTPARTLSSQQAPASWVFFWVLGCLRQRMGAPSAQSAVLVLGSDRLSVSIRPQTWSRKGQAASASPRALHSDPCDG